MFEWLSQAIEWLKALPLYQTIALSVGLFLVGSFGSLLFVSWVVIRLPATYFQDHHAAFWSDRHPVVRWTAVIVKNLIGVLLILIGIVLSLPGVPGQGILTILIGVMLLDFPGKRRLEFAIVRRPVVLGAINRLRERRGKEPLVLDKN